MTVEPASPDLKAPRPGAFSVGTQLLAFFAGIAGGLAFVQLYAGGMLGVLVAYLSPVPLFLVGLTCGRAAAVTATLFALLVVLLRATPDAAVFFACVIGVPTMVLTRVALIKNDDGSYISGGVILLAALTLGTILMAATATLLELQGPGIAAATQVALDGYRTMVIDSEAVRSGELTTEQLDQTLAMLKSALPAMILMSWFMIVSVTGVLSQWFASEIGQNLRPTPLLRTILLPKWMVGILALCIVGGAIAPEDTRMVLTALATLYAIGFVIVGLGAMHRWIDAKAAANAWADGRKLFVYILAYAAIFILQIPVLFLLLFGLIAPFTAPQPLVTNGHSGQPS